ncbi:hypothetical protein BREVNS_1686 [Brevinematales bacterium NS]|jgi:hypothetical protein|nr:hypothetical protein BREVNS_1686 [Brevinematales bacterium NS]
MRHKETLFLFCIKKDDISFLLFPFLENSIFFALVRDKFVRSLFF